jgi:phage baseplate assembly protein gpV
VELSEIGTKEPPKNESHFITGLVVAQDTTNCRVRVKFADLDNATSYWLPVVQKSTQDNKSWWLPDLGEQVVCLMDAEYEDGVVLGSVYSTVDAPDSGLNSNFDRVRFSDNTLIEYRRDTHLHAALYSDGALITYDAAVHALTVGLLTSGANLTITANGTEILINGSGAIVLTTPVDITLQTSLGATSLNTIINALNSVINLLATQVQSGSGIPGTPTPIT